MNRAWEYITQFWRRFWFDDGSPLNLAVARIIFATTSLWILLSRKFWAVSGLPIEFWSAVPNSARWRYLLFPAHSTLEHAAEWIAALALLAAAIGFLPRLSCFVSGLLLYHLAPLEAIIWTPHPYVRGFTISVLALLTIGCSPCGDRLAIQLVRDRRIPERVHADYAWPLRLIQVFIVQIYAFSGYAKLAHSGWQWATANNLRNWMLYLSQEDQVRVFHTLGAWIARSPLLCQVIGIGTLVFELGFVTVLFSRSARRVLVPTAVLFHVLIVVSMNLVFLNIPQLFVFVDWDSLARRFTKKRRDNTRIKQVQIRATENINCNDSQKIAKA